MKTSTRTRVLLSTLKKRATRIDPGSEDELKALARSWLAHPIHPILVRACDLAIGDGNRRVSGLEKLGEVEAEVEMIEGNPTDSDLDLMAYRSAYHRSPLGGYEQACIVRSVKAASAVMTNKEVADEMGIDGSMPTRLLSVFDCLPEVQEAARAGKIGVTAWYEISQSPDQLAALHKALNGSSRAELKRARKPVAGAAARVAKITCPLPSGPVVTVAGDGISLEDAIESLGEAIKFMREAIKKDLTAKTAQAVWKDGAAAG